MSSHVSVSFPGQDYLLQLRDDVYSDSDTSQNHTDKTTEYLFTNKSNEQQDHTRSVLLQESVDDDTVEQKAFVLDKEYSVCVAKFTMDDFKCLWSNTQNTLKYISLLYQWFNIVSDE